MKTLASLIASEGDQSGLFQGGVGRPKLRDPTVARQINPLPSLNFHKSAIPGVPDCRLEFQVCSMVTESNRLFQKLSSSIQPTKPGRESDTLVTCQRARARVPPSANIPTPTRNTFDCMMPMELTR